MLCFMMLPILILFIQDAAFAIFRRAACYAFQRRHDTPPLLMLDTESIGDAMQAMALRSAMMMPMPMIFRRLIRSRRFRAADCAAL